MQNHENRIVDLAESYYNRYRPYMDALARSPLAKVRGGLQPTDVYALGKQLEQFENYRAICEEEGNVGQLGRIPQIAFDVITAVQGASVLPLIANVQPIEEESGIVYFRTVRSGTTRGNVQAGQKLTDPRSGNITPTGFSSAEIDSEEIGTTAGQQTTIKAKLKNLPVRPMTVRVSLQTKDGQLFAQDMGMDSAGVGQLLGNGIYGTVNYMTGDIEVTFGRQVEAGVKVFAAYQVMLEAAADIPHIDSYFESRTLRAQIFALRGSVGMLQSYGMRKRFGMVAEEELAKDLVTEINKEIGGVMIRRLYAGAMGVAQWSMTPPNGVSYFEHKMTFKDAIARAEANIVTNAHRGTISTIVAGSNVSAILQTLPSFVRATDTVNAIGAHVFGTLDGTITVIRVPEAAVLPANEAICLWNSNSGFEGAAIYAPFMPLTVTTTIPRGTNPLLNVRAAAVWAAMDVVVPQFATRLVVTQ